MGKKRIVKKTEGDGESNAKKEIPAVSKKKVTAGLLYVIASYNNTRVLLTDKSGNALASSSSGALGFKGAKKGTPFAAAKVGEVVGDKAKNIGIKDVDVIIKGVGAGRESSVRSFINKGVELNSIKDATPVPHNGPQARKPRRV
ncbi:MAG: 30S ribosomal protein S11 [Patescibacteria group bacterium]